MMTWVLGLSVLLSCLWSASGAAAKTDGMTDAGQASVRRTIVAAIPGHFPPHFRLTGSGEVEGFGIEVLRAVAGLAGLGLRLDIAADWPAALDALQVGLVDVVPGAITDNDPGGVFAFTTPILTTDVRLFVRRHTADGDGVEAQGLEDLRGRPVGALRQNAGLAVLYGYPGVTPVTFDDVPAALFGLVSGRVDGLLASEFSLRIHAAELGVADRIRTAGPAYGESKRGLAVRKNDPALLAQLDRAVVAFLETGEYRRIYQRWFVETEPQALTQTMVTAIALPTLALLVMLFAWHYATTLGLNRQLRRSMAEREQIEQRLRERERDIGVTLDSIGDAVITTDREGRIQRMNPVAELLTGWTGTEAYGRPLGEVFRIVNAVTRSPCPNPADKVIASGRVVGLANHTALIGRDQSERQIADSGAPIRAADGSVLGVVLVFRDVTESYRMTEALMASRAGLAEAQRLARLGNWEWDLERGRICGSEGLARLFGIGSTAFDLSLAGFLAFFEPRDRMPFRTLLEHQTTTPTTHKLEATIREASGGERQVEVSGEAITDENGVRRRVFGTMLDISDRKRAEHALAESERRYRSLIEAAPVAILILAGEMIEFANPHAAWLLAAGNGDDLIGLAVWDIIAPDGTIGMDARLARLFRGEGGGGSREDGEGGEGGGESRESSQGRAVEERFVRRDGREIAVEAVGRTVESSGRKAAQLVFQDISARKAAERSLRTLSQAVEQSPALVFITDPRGVIEYVNTRFCEVTGYQAAEVIGHPPHLFQTGPSGGARFEKFWQTLSSGQEWRGEFLNRKKNKELFWVYALVSPVRDQNGAVVHFLAIEEDITVRRQYEERLLRQANYDQLTGLPSRLLAADRLQQALNGLGGDEVVALLFIDLDNFKHINDTLGHAVGDELLCAAGARLKTGLRLTDTLSRFGGDQFMIVLPGPRDTLKIEVITEGLLERFREPFVLTGHEVFSSISIGITLAPLDGQDAQILMRNADAALHQAKADGRDTFRFFTPELNERARARVTVDYHLRRALERREFFLVYQPIVQAATGKAIGVEALLRWRNPTLGLMPPDRFIPLAEETGMILAIGDWVIREACRQLRDWRDQGCDLAWVAVNVSSRQFRTNNLAATVEQALAAAGLTPSCLGLEITESLLIEDLPRNGEQLRRLHDLGIHISVDDFGTGYSSLSYLARFPVDSLKVDRSFVRDVANGGEAAALVDAIVAMGHRLGLSVVGEGVETVEQQQFLHQVGCDLAQGYHFSVPLPGDQIPALIAKEVLP